MAADGSPEHAVARRRVGLVRLMLGVATLLAILGIFAVWANRQLLNADQWAETSGKVLTHPEVKTQIADYVVDQLYLNVDVAGELQAALPPRLQPLAGPVAGGLRSVATRTTLTLLGRPRVEEAWKAANRITAQQFINIAEGKSSAVTVKGNAVVLNLRSLLIQVAQSLGLPGTRIRALPPDAGAITILKSDQVKLLQDGTAALRSLALVLPILALALLGGAVYLAEGHRRRTLMWAGIDLCLAGFVVLIARNLLGSYVVDALATEDSLRPAAEATWTTGTDLLRDVAQATIIAGLPLLFAAWLAGPTRPAVAARFRLAPALREHAGASYTVLGAILLLIVAWGPIPATRKVIPVIVMAALAALGLHLLRRQTAEEFPPIERGEAPTGSGIVQPDDHAVPAP